MEQLQAELAQVRRRLDALTVEAKPPQLQLEVALVQARARRDAAQARLAELKAEPGRLEAELSWLDRQLEDERVLARGARRLGRSGPWSSSRADQAYAYLMLFVMVAGLVGAFIYFAVQAWLNG